LNKKAVWKIVALSWYYTGLAILGMLFTLLILGIVSVRFIGPAVLISIIGGFLIFSILAFVFSEPLINLFMRAKPAQIDEHPEFVGVAKELFKHKKMWVHPRLYIVDMSVPNAMAYGMGLPGFSAIAITQPLYDLLDRDELKSVVAHELAHIRCKDVGLQTTIGLVTGSVEKLRKVLLGGKSPLGRTPPAFFFAGLLWFVSKVLFGFIRSAISQERELAADALGASYFGSPDPLIRALGKLAGTSEENKKFVLSDLMVSHPGMNERIKSLETLKNFKGG